MARPTLRRPRLPQRTERLHPPRCMCQGVVYSKCPRNQYHFFTIRNVFELRILRRAIAPAQTRYPVRSAPETRPKSAGNTRLNVAPLSQPRQLSAGTRRGARQPASPQRQPAFRDAPRHPPTARRCARTSPPVRHTPHARTPARSPSWAAPPETPCHTPSRASARRPARGTRDRSRCE